MTHHLITGKKGEELASRYLLSEGYKIRHRNWVFEKDELDIVAEKNNIVVFVEVKTRSYTAFGFPEDAVDKKKLRKMMRAVEAYLDEFQIDNEIRIDVISVLIEDNVTKINHFEDIYSGESN